MNRKATAYHEAGHAIAARCRGIPVKSVSIAQGADSHGRMIFSNPGLINFDGSRDRAQLRAESQIIVALAGSLAQRKFMPRSVRGWHGEGDYTWAVEMALRLHVPPEIDLKAIRMSLDLTQRGFAYTFGFGLDQVKQWEQKRSRPLDGSRAQYAQPRRAAG